MRSVLFEEGFPPAIKETYLAQIHGLEGSRQYRNLFVVHPDGSTEDVIREGDLACAYVVSSPLTLCMLTSGGIHTTVDELERDLQSSKWKPVETPVPGTVIIWTPKLCTDGLRHRHVGFALGNDVAISNDSWAGMPRRHHITFGGTRAIEKIYYHPMLGSV